MLHRRQFAAALLLAAAAAQAWAAWPDKPIRIVVTFAAGGTAGGPEAAMKIELTPIPYKGGAPMTTDLISGPVPLGIDVITTSVPMVKADPAIGKRLEELGITPVRMGSAAFGAFVAKPVADRQPAIRAADVKN